MRLSKSNVLLLSYDGSGVDSADCALGGEQGRIQAVGARVWPRWRARTAAAAGATGADDGAGRPGEAGSRALEHSEDGYARGRDARQPDGRAARSAPRRLW